MENFSVETLTDRLLGAIADGYDILYYAHRRPGELMTCGLSDLRSLEAERARARVSRELWKLRRKGLIIERKENDQRAFALTKLGEKAASVRRPPAPSRLPVGQKLLISFDIPERYRAARASLRRCLRSLGFQRKHYSLWESDRDWSEFLLKYLQGNDIRTWVEIYIGTRVS